MCIRFVLTESVDVLEQPRHFERFEVFNGDLRFDCFLQRDTDCLWSA